ncbi:diguanylate cyclase [Klebsiella pneumoniae]|uniref:Diguanylate cyclase n=1 Tax=Klebsiella pneumoniae TaxID=573 RepID=A0A939SV11_KLEPN|nr:diguanylate cyclase [Klebsiella pneumoniae]
MKYFAILQICWKILVVQKRCCKIRGDEFGVLLPESTYKEAEEFLHKLRAGITSYNLNSQKIQHRFSAGIIEYDEKFILNALLSCRMQTKECMKLKGKR